MLRPAALALVLAACNGARDDSSRAPESVTPAPAPAATTPLSGDARQPCAADGLWSSCAVLERLNRAGLVPRLDSVSVTEPPLTLAGSLIRVGSAQLELYIYSDQAARERDAAMLDRAKYVAYGTPVPIQQLPTVIQSANLIGIFHSRNDHQRERVGDAITAGPPQPPRP